MSGPHQGEFFGMAATGRRISVAGFDMVRFAGGKVAEHRMAMDRMGMMQQPGLMPAPGQPG